MTKEVDLIFSLFRELGYAFEDLGVQPQGLVSITVSDGVFNAMVSELRLRECEAVISHDSTCFEWNGITIKMDAQQGRFYHYGNERMPYDNSVFHTPDEIEQMTRAMTTMQALEQAIPRRR